MSSVRQALLKLDLAVNKLENSLESLETSTPVGQQRDMFGAPASNQNTGKGKNNVVSAPVLARRLDSAIEKVELLLKEGRA